MRADMEALSELTGRYAGTEGERAMLHAVRERLPESVDSRIEGFVSHVSPAFVYGLHLALLLVFGLLGLWFPKIASLLCAVVVLSLVGEGTGRFVLLRRALPKAASYNLVVHQNSAGSLGAVVIATPLDLATWKPQRRWAGWRPLQVVFGAAVVLLVMLLLRSLGVLFGPRTFELYGAALAVLALAGVVGGLSYRSGEGSDDAGGPAAVLELVRHLVDDPVPGLDVWFAFTGCGHAFHGGMDAFLALHEDSLPEPCLVIAVDEPARPPTRAAISEGSLVAQHHRPTGPALVERLRWAGVFVPPIDLGRPTDARAALVRGYRALAFTGGDGPPTPEAGERVVDVVLNVIRWYGEDLARVADVRPALQELARATAQVRDGERTEEDQRAEASERESVGGPS